MGVSPTGIAVGATRPIWQKILISILEDVAESILTGTPIVTGILLGLPEAFITAMIAGDLGLLDSFFVGFAVKELYQAYQEQEQENAWYDDEQKDSAFRYVYNPVAHEYENGELHVTDRIGIAIGIGALGFARVPSSVYEVAKGAVSAWWEAPEELLL